MLKKIICSEKNSLRKALKIIDKNAMGVCFIVDKSKALKEAFIIIVWDKYMIMQCTYTRN